jgi:hypothetical protein
MSVNAKDSLGRRGEQAAVEYLERAGLHQHDSLTCAYVI